MNKIGDVELGRRPAIVGVLRSLSILKAKEAKESGADIIELRMDLLEEEEKSIEKMKEFVKALKKDVDFHLPIIATNRKREEGGCFRGSEEERIDLLNNIIGTTDVDAVDIEFFSEKKGISRITEKANSFRIPVIFSFHDFQGMPRREEISNIVENMYEEGGKIAKIAVTPKSLSDALLLLELLLKISSERKLLVVIGMGEVGRHLRVIAPLYGSALTYGFIEGEGKGEAAPGQFSVKELRNILEKFIPSRSKMNLT